MTQQKIPTPEEMLVLAKREPMPERFVPLHEYGEALDELQKRNYTYREMSIWLLSRGLDYTPAHISNSLSQWRVLHPVPIPK